MKKVKNKKLTSLLIIIGIGLIVLSVITVFSSQILQNTAYTNAKQIVSKMRYLMPETRSGYSENRADVTMPMLELDGANFIGIFDLPIYDVTLPIYAEWKKENITKYPCRYSGSVYDDSLIIGASDNQGQFDFMKIITTGDVMYVTDVTGLRYSYTVDKIEKTKDITTENLTSEDSDLVLFARSTYSFDYTIIRCKKN